MNRGRRGWRGLAALLASGVLAAVITACGQPLQSVAGLVVEVDSPSLGRVDSFDLRTVDGEILTFDTNQLEFRSEFPAAHLGEHMRMAEPVRVTYRVEDGRLVVVRLADES